MKLPYCVVIDVYCPSNGIKPATSLKYFGFSQSIIDVSGLEVCANRSLPFCGVEGLSEGAAAGQEEWKQKKAHPYARSNRDRPLEKHKLKTAGLDGSNQWITSPDETLTWLILWRAGTTAEVIGPR